MHNILTTLAATLQSTGKLTPSVSNNSDTGVYTVGNDPTDLLGSVTGIINGVIGVLGFVCVVVMIVGGVNYMISAGDSGKVTKAKNTILYGLIGLVICVLAFAIVNFVIGNIINGQSMS